MENIPEDRGSEIFGHEVDGYKFIDPDTVIPSGEATLAAREFLLKIGFTEEDQEAFIEGTDLVATMLTMADQTLEEAPIKWRFSADLDTPDDRCIVLLAQKHETGISKDLLVVNSFEASEEVREAFMQSDPAEESL